MAQRVIPCKVIDDYITGDGVTIGGAGSHNEVLLELDFRADDAEWRGTTRTVTFTDATGETYVNVLLTTDLLKKDQYGDPVDPEVYMCPVPYNVKQHPGWITVTVTGTEVGTDPACSQKPIYISSTTAEKDTSKVYVYTGDDSGTWKKGHWYKYYGSDWVDMGVYAGDILRIATGAARFRVLPNDLVRWWDDPRDVPWPPSSVAEQLQAEIDEIKELVRTQWVYLFIEDGDLYEQIYTGQPFGFALTEDGYLEVRYTS